MKYDLIVIGAGPGGLMAARTAAREGLKVLIVEKKQNVSEVKRLCSQLIRLGPGGFSSDHIPKDMPIKQTSVSFETDFGRHTMKLSVGNLKDLGVSIDYRGSLRTYHNEIWVSPGLEDFTTLPGNDDFYGFCIDKEALLASLLDDCVKAGCEVRPATKCSAVEDGPDGILCTVASPRGTEKLSAKRTVIADGAFSPLMEQLGFNAGRGSGGPPLKFLCCILDRLDAPYPESRFLKLVVPSIHKGQISLGLWPHERYQLEISVPLGSPLSLPEIMDAIMKRSPFAPWFAKSKVVTRMACNMSLDANVDKPARGNIICAGDNAAYAETAIKGALGCGYMAGVATKTALEGGDGNAQYNQYWRFAFYAHSPEYRSFGRRTLPTARMLDDAETDMLYRWIRVNGLHGMVNDIVPDHLDRLKSELPQIAAKVVMPARAAT